MNVPKIVTDTTRQSWSRRRFMGGAVSVAALASLAACSSATRQPTSASTLGMFGTPATPTSPVGGTTAIPSATPMVTAIASGVDAELIASRYGGL